MSVDEEEEWEQVAGAEQVASSMKEETLASTGVVEEQVGDDDAAGSVANRSQLAEAENVEGENEMEDEELEEEEVEEEEVEEEEVEEDPEDDEEGVDAATPSSSLRQRTKASTSNRDSSRSKSRPRYNRRRSYRQRQKSYASSTDDSSFYSDSDDDSEGGLICCGPRCINYISEVLAIGATVFIIYAGWKVLEYLWYFVLYMLGYSTQF